MDADRIFISHATPEDNEFVRWLGTRLTGHGFKVWAELFDVKGGSPFWTSIEEALRTRVCKFIYVISKASVDIDRNGVRNELSVADAVKKTRKDRGFIIPIRLDDTPHDDFPIQVHQLNALDFSKGWGPKFIELLDTLDSADVPKSRDDQAAEFDLWRSSMVQAATVVENGRETVVTNLLPINQLPEKIHFYGHNHDAAKIAAALQDTGIPFASFHRLIISFAEFHVLQDALGGSFTLTARATENFETFLDGCLTNVTSPKRDEARKIATALLRKHIERHLVERGLRRYETASGSSLYFPSGLLPNNKVPYVSAAGRRTNKNVVGRSERNKVNWHLSMKVNVVLGPPAIVRFKPYVCFSEDGQTALNDPKRTSAIRKRFCKNWWNSHWRQLQEAFCVFLADGADQPIIMLDGSQKVGLAARLLELSATRRMPSDFALVDEAQDDPIEPDDEDDDIEEIEGDTDEQDDPS